MAVLVLYILVVFCGVVFAGTPVVDTFSVVSPVSSCAVPVNSFSGHDPSSQEYITGYAISESSNAPSYTSNVWRASPWNYYSWGSCENGSRTLYGYVKCSGGDRSTGRSAVVNIVLPSSFISVPAGVDVNTLASDFGSFVAPIISVIALLVAYRVGKKAVNS